MRKDCYYFGVFATDNDALEYSTSKVDEMLNTSNFDTCYKNRLENNIINEIGSTKFYYINESLKISTLERSIFLLSYYELESNPNDRYIKDGTLLPTADAIFNSNYNDTQTRYWLRSITKDSASSSNKPKYIFVAALPGDVDPFILDIPGDMNSYRPCFTLPSSAKVTSGLDIIV